MPTVDAWVWREWFAVIPGMETVDERDLAGMSPAEVWMVQKGMEAG